MPKSIGGEVGGEGGREGGSKHLPGVALGGPRVGKRHKEEGETAAAGLGVGAGGDGGGVMRGVGWGLGGRG